jgi:hypothetical protein
VWAFATTVWEMYSCGTQPYPDYDATLIIDAITRGYRLPRPKMCTRPVYEILMRCWEQNPVDRPKFSAVEQLLRNANDGGFDAFDIIRDKLILTAEEENGNHQYEYEPDVVPTPISENHDYEYEDAPSVVAASSKYQAWTTEVTSGWHVVIMLCLNIILPCGI